MGEQVREIKLRGYCKSTKGWLYGNLVHYKEGFDMIYYQKPNESYMYGDVVDIKSIGQYTGLKDKKGKEIYEGDIVKSISGKIGYVIFLQQEMGYVVVWDNCDTRLGHRNRGGGYECDGSIEVVGNVYDNPELVEQ